MKSLRDSLKETHKRTGVRWDVVERDYVLSWILAGISRIPSLKDTLVFKGGTALRKCYFGDYRFSEDLDFSGTGGVPHGDSMERAIREACGMAERLPGKLDTVEFVCERYVEKRPHPGRQEAFTVDARLPWQKKVPTRVKVEITMDERIIRPVRRRKIIHQYDEPFEAEFRVYSLEEVVAEKLCAILQNTERVRRRGWGRPRARDYYDLWRVLGDYGREMDFTDFGSFLREKCSRRDLDFNGAEDFFDKSMLTFVEGIWHEMLEHLTPELPSFETVIGELRGQIADLVFAGR